MNGSHLPAGQPMPGGGGVAGASGPRPGPNAGRRRPPSQYSSHQGYHPQQQFGHGHSHMYQQSSYMNPYASSYHPQMQYHYQNGHVQHSPYSMPYPPYPQPRSPVLHQHQHQHQQYPPIVSSNMHAGPQPFSRPPPPPQQPSPAISTPPPYSTVAPPPPVPVPQTPSSTHSSQAVQAPLTPPTPQTQDMASSRSEGDVLPIRTPYRPPLPWLSRPDLPFPSRTARSRRRRPMLDAESQAVELPKLVPAGHETANPQSTLVSDVAAAPATPKARATSAVDSEAAGLPTTAASKNVSPADVQPTIPSTPASVQAARAPTADSSSPSKHTRTASRAAIPAVPILPILPKTSPKETKNILDPELRQHETKQATAQEASSSVDDAPAPVDESSQTEAKSEPASAWTAGQNAPKLWSRLFQPKAPVPATSTRATSADAGAASATTTADSSATEAGSAVTGSFTRSNVSSLADALRAYRVDGAQKTAFLEPRGLINPGNMCYMNSVLQVLIFCIPFYDFLDQVSRKAAHSFKSETPLIDAMIMFSREYKIIDSAVSVDQLRMRLRSEELEQYGEPFTPEFVYEAIRKLPRFASMRRGHQQDAEEFLGFLLESLHDECAQVMRHVPESSATTATTSTAATSTAASSPTSTADANDWLEVGRKQRPVVTRSSGHPVTSSPITKIFGGQLRSELRVTGNKESVTLEPFQPLQLDIGSPQIHNIVDALKNLTKAETIQGDFSTSRGPGASATKQVLIESLPPVLILHLKRFQFDAEGTGTVKIWKKVGYPLELELPREVFSRQKRNMFTAEGAGFPRYRLMAAVYHHGKNASGGHYTVDLRRQDGREWIRMDDTVIRRIRSEDVAEGGAEEEKSKLSARTEKKDAVVGGSSNRFDGIGDEDAGEEEGWNKVSASVNGTRKWSSVLNGDGAQHTPTPTKGKQAKDNIKDNKVAYLLFYQRI
ncbi:cysteine proteinase [Xylariaceae sp. FL0804]|nr:cysteine proteinase [Xylariaceae sp. FL0804]